MKVNRIYSGKISPCEIFPKKDFCIVWVLLTNKSDCWVKVLFSGNGFFHYGTEVTRRVTAWQPLTETELQSYKNVKQNTGENDSGRKI